MDKTKLRFNSARFREALIYSAQLHATQPRKGTNVPYIAHLLGVASIVIEYGGREDEAIAALLHDSVEDQGGKATLERIHDLFGAVVAKIVSGCTDSVEESKPEWIERKAKYIVHLQSASRSVRLVSAADKLHNVRSTLKDYREIGDAVFGRFNKPKHHTLWYYRRLADEFIRLGPKLLAEELARTVAELEKLVEATSGREYREESVAARQELDAVVDRTRSMLKKPIGSDAD